MTGNAGFTCVGQGKNQDCSTSLPEARVHTRSLAPDHFHANLTEEIAATLREFGIDPDTIIKAAGLDPHFANDDARAIPFAALGRVLGLSVSQAHCPHFGLLVGQRATILSLGIVGRLMQQSETVEAALQALIANSTVQDRGAVMSLSGNGDTAFLTFSIYQPASESTDQISDAFLALIVNALRTLCGPRWHPSDVFLPRVVPMQADPYRRHFRTLLHYNQETATIAFPAKDLTIRIAGADPLMRTVLQERIHQMNAKRSNEFSDGIRRLLRMRLTSTRCSAENIAELLAIHRRTLSRRLKGSGIGYRTIANETRFEIARQLLEDTEVPLGQIAAALGYSEASAFTRAFRRWSGRTPTSWRADDRNGPPPSTAQTVKRLSSLIKHAPSINLQ